MSYLSLLDSLKKKEGSVDLDQEPLPDHVKVEQMDENAWRATATFEPTVPLSGKGEETDLEPETKLEKQNPVQKEWGKFKKQGVKRYVGPHGAQALENAKTLVETVGPQAATKGAVEHSAKSVEAFKNKDFGKAAAHFGLMGVDAVSMAAPLVGGGLAAGSKAATKQGSKLANNSFVGHNTPTGYKRTLEQDYPNGAQTDKSGNLTHDIDGRPLLDRARIAGRSRADQGSRSIGPEEFDDIAMASTGSPAKRTSLPPETWGQTNYKTVTKKPTGVELSDKLTPEQTPIVYGHEIGHVIDQFVGEIPTKGLSKELKEVYNTLNNPQKHGKSFTPEHNKYVGEDIPREYMAEAIRAYMENPDYLKTVAPKTAKQIRKLVNSNPDLRKIIQFNSAGGAALGLNHHLDDED